MLSLSSKMIGLLLTLDLWTTYVHFDLYYPSQQRYNRTFFSHREVCKNQQ